jgi:hypothetical protein
MRIEADIDDRYIGHKYADAFADRQLEFFKGFAAGVSTFCNNSYVAMQFLEVAEKLTAREKALLKSALSCLWYEEEA